MRGIIIILEDYSCVGGSVVHRRQFYDHCIYTALLTGHMALLFLLLLFSLEWVIRHTVSCGLTPLSRKLPYRILVEDFEQLQQSPRCLSAATGWAKTTRCSRCSQVPRSNRAVSHQLAAFLFNRENTEAHDGLTFDILNVDKLMLCNVLPHN